jgi:flagellar motor switch protein FliG
MQKLRYESLTGRQKAAILLVAIGVEAATKIFKSLRADDVELLTQEITNLRSVPSDVIYRVVEEFYQMLLSQKFVSDAGEDYAREVLEKALGPDQAIEMLRNMKNVKTIEQTGFSRLADVPRDRLANFLQKEHPQTVAVVLAHLDPNKASKIYDEFPQEFQIEVAYRLARLDQVSPQIIKEIEAFIDRNFKTEVTKEIGEINGEKVVADILNQAGKVTEKTVLEGLVRVDPELATQIKNLMFTFDDLILVDNRSMQKILKEVDSKELSLALKGASEEVKEKIFGNMSERAANMLREELEFMGPVRVKEVEEAQRRILTIVANLEESGEIVIHREGGEEDVIV